MRVYDEATLKECSRDELLRKLDMVKVNDDLTYEEIDENIRRIEFALNGGVHNRREDVEKDIEAGMADISDMRGMN